MWGSTARSLSCCGQSSEGWCGCRRPDSDAPLVASSRRLDILAGTALCGSTQTRCDEIREANVITGNDLPGPGARVIPLTAAQRSIWFAQQLTPDVPYVIAQYVELRGPVDLDLLAEASEQARRELGGGFIKLVDVDGHPHQVLGMTSAKPVPVVDFRGDSVEAAQAWMRNESCAPIEMYGESLIVSHILQLADEHFYWYSRAHHIALDGYAAMMSMRRAAELYVAAIDGVEAPQRQMIDPEQIVQEDAEYRSSPRFGRDRDYWHRQVLELPPRGQPQSAHSATRRNGSGGQ